VGIAVIVEHAATLGRGQEVDDEPAAAIDQAALAAGATRVFAVLLVDEGTVADSGETLAEQTERIEARVERRLELQIDVALPPVDDRRRQALLEPEAAIVRWQRAGELAVLANPELVVGAEHHAAQAIGIEIRGLEQLVGQKDELGTAEQTAIVATHESAFAGLVTMQAVDVVRRDGRRRDGGRVGGGRLGGGRLRIRHR
jgi:hypothetical protein